MSLTLSIPFNEYNRAAFDHALNIIDTLAPAQPEPIQSVLIGLATADLATLLDAAHSEALIENAQRSAPCSHVFPRHSAACRKCGVVTLRKWNILEPSYFHDGDYADLMGLATIPRNDLRLLHWAIGGGTL